MDYVNTNNGNSKVLVTPDYTVHRVRKVKAANQGYNNREVDEQELWNVHAKFVKFRDGLKKLGFLPEDEAVQHEVSFAPEDVAKPVRAIRYNVETLHRFLNSKATEAERRSQWGFMTTVPPLHLFEANVTVAQVFGFTSQNSRMFNKAFKELRAVKAQQGQADLIPKIDGSSYADTLKVLGFIKRDTDASLVAAGVEPTARNMVRKVCLTRFVEKGYSYAGQLQATADGPVFPKVVEDYINNLLRNDVKLYNGVIALSRQVNSEIRVNYCGDGSELAAPVYDADMFVAFEDAPEAYVARMLIPQTD